MWVEGGNLSTSHSSAFSFKLFVWSIVCLSCYPLPQSAMLKNLQEIFSNRYTSWHWWPLRQVKKDKASEPGVPGNHQKGRIMTALWVEILELSFYPFTLAAAMWVFFQGICWGGVWGMELRQSKTPRSSLLLLRFSHLKKKINVTAVGKSKTLLNLQCSEKVNFDHFFVCGGAVFSLLLWMGNFVSLRQDRQYRNNAPPRPPPQDMDSFS